MNIDQRLDKLAERHTALYRNMERFAEDQRKGSERRSAAFAGYEAMMAKNQVLLTRILESIDSAKLIANGNEQRVTGREDRPQ